MRCWGSGLAGPVPYSGGWTYDRREGNPQGYVATLAGGAGYSDTIQANALAADVRASSASPQARHEPAPAGFSDGHATQDALF